MVVPDVRRYKIDAAKAILWSAYVGGLLDFGHNHNIEVKDMW